jgi:hypothetical protein
MKKRGGNQTKIKILEACKKEAPLYFGGPNRLGGKNLTDQMDYY